MDKTADVEKNELRESDLLLAFIGYANENGCKSFPASAEIWWAFIDALGGYAQHFQAFPCAIGHMEVWNMLNGLAIAGTCVWLEAGDRFAVEDSAIFKEKKEILIERGGRDLLDVMLDLARHEPGFFSPEGL